MALIEQQRWYRNQAVFHDEIEATRVRNGFYRELARSIPDYGEKADAFHRARRERQAKRKKMAEQFRNAGYQYSRQQKWRQALSERVAQRGLSNVRLACADARALLQSSIPEASVAAVHVYFPDPWWKTRHHKRRVFTAEFAAQCVRVLTPGGVLSFASDVEAYAQTVYELVATLPRLRPLPPPQPGTPAHDMDYLTNFERKASKDGRAIHRGRWEKL